MIQLLWPWAFAALPLPWLYRAMTRPVPNRDAALRVPDTGRFAFGLAVRGGVNGAAGSIWRGSRGHICSGIAASAITGVP
jgi:hypothetical protein